MSKFKSFSERERAYDEQFEDRKYCSVIAAVVVGGAVAYSAYEGGQAAEGAAATQAQGMSNAAASSAEVARIQQESAREYLNFQKQQYADMKPLAEAVSNKQMQTMDQQMRIADSNEARASEYANYERSTFRPLEQGLVKDANEFDTDAKREELARRGMADVATAYEAQRKQAMDTLARYGINPNSNRFAAINAQLSQGQAADSAGVATNARTNAEQLGYARKIDAASLGRNLASNASTAYGIATSAGNSANASGATAMDSASAPGTAMGGAYGSYSTQMGNAGASYTNAGNIYARGYGIAANQASEANSALSGIVGMGIKGAMGYATGGMSGAASAMTGIRFADGGKVHVGKGGVSGPGGPVDDKIPAMLSNGEYVLPTDTVKAIGKAKLDKLVAKTHTPAKVQRQRALKGA
jgi:hypothetical protein